MSALASLLVRDQVVSIRQIESAIQRQAVFEGDLDTALLEMDLISEHTMGAYRAALFDVLPATREEVMGVGRDAIRVVSQETVRKYRIVPLRAEDGTLVAAATAPLRPEIRQQLESECGYYVVIRVVPEVRLAAGLAHHYGVDMAPRMRRLTEKLRQADPGPMPYVKPPAELNHISQSPFKVSAPLDPGSKPDAISSSAGKSDLTQTSQDANSGADTGSHRTQAEPVRSLPALGLQNTGLQNTGLQKTTSEISARKLRGPLLGKRAAKLLESAQSTNEILEVLFVYARQFFDYTALFLVRDGEAEGQLAFGPGATTAELKQRSISLLGTSVLSKAHTSGSPQIARSRDELGAGISGSLGRIHAKTSVVVPFLVRTRPVVLLYGDRGDEVFQLSNIPELMGLSPSVGEAFERLILQRKLGAKPPAKADRPHPTVHESPNDASVSDSPNAPSARSTAAQETANSSDNLAEEPSEPQTRGKWRYSEPPSTGRRRNVLGLGFSEESHGPSGTPSPETEPRLFDQQRPLQFDMLGVPRSAPPPPEATTEAPRESEPATESLKAAATAEPEVPEGSEDIEISSAELSPSPNEDQPTVIVDMGDDVHALVEELSTEPREHNSELIDRVLRLGKIALPILIQRFPGSIWLEEWSEEGHLPKGEDISAISRALVRFGEPAIPYLICRFDDRDDKVRFYATLLASAFRHPSLVAPLGKRVFDSNPNTRTIALRVLIRSKRFSTEFEEVLRGIRAAARLPRKDIELRTVAVQALVTLRDSRSTATLIELLSEKDEPLTTSVHAALRTLTRQDFGYSAPRWQAWAEQHGAKHRIEWLIDALTHEDETLRAQAANELKTSTQKYFGYHPSLTKREREVCQRKYRSWWEAGGRIGHKGT
ncbi:MAG: hypothetical protein AAF355_05550 [Myxococcota bacterium]